MHVNTMIVILMLEGILSSLRAVFCTTAAGLLLFVLISVHVKYFLLPSRHQSNPLIVVLCIMLYIYLFLIIPHFFFFFFKLNNVMLGAVALQQRLQTLDFSPSHLDFPIMVQNSTTTILSTASSKGGGHMTVLSVITVHFIWSFYFFEQKKKNKTFDLQISAVKAAVQ